MFYESPKVLETSIGGNGKMCFFHLGGHCPEGELTREVAAWVPSSLRREGWVSGPSLDLFSTWSSCSSVSSPVPGDEGGSVFVKQQRANREAGKGKGQG